MVTFTAFGENISHQKFVQHKGSCMGSAKFLSSKNIRIYGYVQP
jgi:hypothetical protein